MERRIALLSILLLEVEREENIGSAVSSIWFACFAFSLYGIGITMTFTDLLDFAPDESVTVNLMV
jgi:hypothetical protein